jgi:hypothetical protein
MRVLNNEEIQEISFGMGGGGNHSSGPVPGESCNNAMAGGMIGGGIGGAAGGWLGFALGAIGGFIGGAISSCGGGRNEGRSPVISAR